MPVRPAFAAALAAAMLCVALVAVSVMDSSRGEVLLAKSTVGPSSSAASAALSSHHPGLAKNPPHHLLHKLPPAVQAAEKHLEEVEKEQKERLLAKAAKSAMSEYSSFEKESKLALQEQDAHARNLVSSAAKELIAQEALQKQKEAEKRKQDGLWEDAVVEEKKSKSKQQLAHGSAGGRWRARMEAAEKAALDVIEKTDHASARSAEAWKSYAEKQKAKIQQAAKKEAALEKKQEQHITKMVEEGKLKATTPIKISEAHKRVKPLTPIQKARIEKKLEVKAANRELAKQDAEVKAKVREIARKELPSLESHLNHQVKSMEARKHWSKIERAAAAEEKAREGSWKKMVNKVKKEVHSRRSTVVSKQREEAEKEEQAQKAIKKQTAAHLQSEVSEIIGSSVAGKRIVAALKHINKVVSTSQHPISKSAVSSKAHTEASAQQGAPHRKLSVKKGKTPTAPHH